MRPISLLFALALLPFGLPAAEAKVAPPPPSFSFESSTETSGVQAQAVAPAAALAPADSATEADTKLFGGTPGSAEDDGNMPAAPAISDEALIANSMEVAYQLYHAEDFQGAAQSCQQIIDRYTHKDLLNVRYLLALSHEHNRAYLEALSQYAYIIKHQPKSTFANAASFRVGLCHLAIGHVEEAVRTFRDIIDFNPKSEYRLQAFIHLGNVYRSQMAWRQCEVIYKDMIRLYPCSTWSATASLRTSARRSAFWSASRPAPTRGR